MSDLIVLIRGLAFCCPKRSETQVLFPHAPGHELKITRGVLGHQLDIPKALSGENTLRIVAENDAASISPDDPKNDLINIAHWHNQAASKVSFRVRDSDPASMPISFLSMPGARVFSGESFSDLDYEMWAHRTGGLVPLRDFLGQPPRRNLAEQDTSSPKLAEEALIKYRIPLAGSKVPAVNLFVNDDPNPEQTFVDQAGVNHVLILDNHCKDTPCVPDFGYYYEMLVGTDKDGNNVEINEFPLRIRFEDRFGPDSEAACNPVLGYTRCDLDRWRNGGPGCEVTENP